jgi:hypothetical protein
MIPELLSAGWPANSVWQLPRTSTAGEHCERTMRVDLHIKGGVIAIHVQDFRTYESLSDACRLGGHNTVWFPPAQPCHFRGVAAAIWDGIHCEDDELARLERVVSRHRPQPVIALLDLLRRDDHDRALAAGASAVIAKPFLASDLLWQLDLAVHETGRLPAVPSAA